MDEEDDGMTSGEKIKHLRKAKKVTQTDLAMRIGKTKSSIQKYEAGTTNMPMNVLYQIARVFDVTVEDLLPDEAESKSVEVSKSAAVQEPAAGHGSAAANFNEALRQYIIHCVEAMDDRKALLELASDVERVMSMLAEEEAKAECD